MRPPTLLGEQSDVSNQMIQPAGIREVSITVEPPAYTCSQNTSGWVSFVFDPKLNLNKKNFP